VSSSDLILAISLKNKKFAFLFGRLRRLSTKPTERYNPEFIL